MSGPQVITSLACSNWLVWDFSIRNDLVSVFHQTLTLAKGGWRQITIQAVKKGAAKFGNPHKMARVKSC